MYVEALTQCSDSCGWVAAIVGAIAYGSYGVPIRSTKHLEVHPLVLQSFKTVLMFVLSWLVLFLGVEPEFTWWGLASGSLWVVGGTGGVYAIRMAGLAAAVGTWAPITVLVNFCWGILVFHEPVANVYQSACAFCLMALGLVGMSHFSSPSKNQEINATKNSDDISDTAADTIHDDDDNDNECLVKTQARVAPIEMDGLHKDQSNNASEGTVKIWNFTVRKSTAGIAGAVLNGVMTGSALIPMHYAQKSGFANGAHYMISMASGALMANSTLWVLLFLYRFQTGIRHTLSYRMPEWHLRAIVAPGIMAGILLSISMFCSILAVTYLGQAIGNSVVQNKILVSGLWGIFYFGEIKSVRTISFWFLSAMVAMSGILWLSRQRYHGNSNHALQLIADYSTQEDSEPGDRL